MPTTNEPRRTRSSWDAKPGATIARAYTVERALGGGERAEVYLARTRSDARVVVKVLRPVAVNDVVARAAMRHEASIVRALAHPSIVRLEHEGVSDDPPHLVFAYVPGRSLRAQVRAEGRMRPPALLEIGLPLASALAHTASLAVVHLDVKPPNVILGAVPVLIDFGTARTLAEARALTEPVGTPPYMAPEQAAPSARGPVTAAADVWGLGVTLWTALTGARPFEAGDQQSPIPERRYPQLVNRPSPLSRRVPRELAALLTRCLDPDPVARPTAMDLTSELRALAERPRRRWLGAW